jgi:hypothetical protein
MIGREREIPPPKPDPGMETTDDHVASRAPRGGHQPTEGLDRGVGDEHLASASQGVRPEEVPTGSDHIEDDEAVGGGPDGEEETGSGPAFEPER